MGLMMKIIDSVFGELTFDDYDWVNNIDISIFGKTTNIELVVQPNDDDNSIFDEQRMAYDDFINNKDKLIKDIELAVAKYYKEVLLNTGRAQVDDKEIPDLVEPLSLIFPMVLNAGETRVGLSFNADCDPEHGIGVLLKNGNIEEVSTEDIVL